MPLNPRALPCPQSAARSIFRADPWKVPSAPQWEGSRPQEEEQTGVGEVPIIESPNPTPFPCLPSLPSPRGLQEQGQPLQQQSQNNKTLMEITKEGGEKREQGQGIAHIIPSS